MLSFVESDRELSSIGSYLVAVIYQQMPSRTIWLLICQWLEHAMLGNFSSNQLVAAEIVELD